VKQQPHQPRLLLRTTWAIVCLIILALVGCGVKVEDPAQLDRRARIRPDYSDTVLPPNIAPTNFCIDEPGKRYVVKVSSAAGPGITINSRGPGIAIPEHRWRRLLEGNRGEELRFDVYVQGEEGGWSRFQPITNRISPDEIDPYIVYRRMNSLYNIYTKMSICERNVESFRKRDLVNNRSFEGCVNCHTFLNNSPDKTIIQMRSGPVPHGFGMLLIQDGNIAKIDTKTPRSIGLAAVTSWHPSGRLVAFSMNKFRQFFHTARPEVRDVIDMQSDLAVYLVGEQKVAWVPELATPEWLETYPTWAPDGKHLYFCRAPVLWDETHTVPPPRYAEVRYSLMRVGCDIEARTWGAVETVLSAEETGQSITLPRFSPDGRFLVFCMSNYSTFPTFQPDSDLYIMDMESGEYRRMECNSEYAESWHCWSRNGRWLVFSSKRANSPFIRAYFTHIDESGRSSKAFVLPQKDPAFYDSCIRLFQIPELISAPVPVAEGEIADAIMSRSQPWIGGAGPVTGASPSAAQAPVGQSPYGSQRP